MSADDARVRCAGFIVTMSWETGGAGGIRTLDTAFQPYNGLANRRLQPLGHSSADPAPYIESTKLGYPGRRSRGLLPQIPRRLKGLDLEHLLPLVGGPA